MNDHEVVRLIFLPGFSTAEQITNVSGRGVGMDVVKTNIERIGGKVGIHSQLSLGTTLKIRIPLTLAIMPALVVSASRQRYAIPQVNVLELVRLEGDEARTGIEAIQDVLVYRLRGEFLPLIWLDRELRAQRGAPPTGGPTGGSARDDVANIVVLQADDRTFGLIVDDVNDTQEIVVKPLGKTLRGLSTFAGATIMGDGRVVLILDVPGLAVHAQVLSELRDANAVRAEMASQTRAEPLHSLLLFAGAGDVRMAVPLSQVTRLEEFPRASLERTGDQEVVQYRGDILPLVNIADALPERRRQPRRVVPMNEARDAIQTIVYAKDGRHVGLVVDRIVDTIDHSLVNLRPASGNGGAASLVIQGRVTEMVDLDAICDGLTAIPYADQLLTRRISERAA